MVSVSLPALLSDPAPQARPLDGVAPQRWVFDAGCTGEGLAWREHLNDAGLESDRLLALPMSYRTAGGRKIHVPVRKAALWLFSNIPSLEASPYRIPLNPGIPFVDAPWPPGSPPDLYRPVLGLGALLRAGVKLTISSRANHASLWVPDYWAKNAWLWLRRLPTGFRTRPPPWQVQI